MSGTYTWDSLDMVGQGHGSIKGHTGRSMAFDSAHQAPVTSLAPTQTAVVAQVNANQR